MNAQLKNIINSAKGTIKKSKKSTQENFTRVTSTTSDALVFMSKTTTKLKSYLRSDTFEDDLDQAIALMHIHQPNSIPNFDDIADRNQRVAEKTHYLKEQALLFVTASGLAGGKVGLYFGNPAMGLKIGTAAGAIIVTVTATTIIAKRLSDDPYVENSLVPIN